jgi:hypothetical protein
MKKKYTTFIEYSFKDIHTGSDLSLRRLEVIEARSSKKGPLVWLTGGIHGDEVGGIVVIQEIIKRLKKFPLLKGTVKCLPLMNPMGFETATRSIPISEEDLNRSFPGDPNGSFAQRLAEIIFKTITATKPSLVLDLHNDWTLSVPYVLLDSKHSVNNKSLYEKIRLQAERSKFWIVEETDDALVGENIEKTLTGSLVVNEIPAITLELGEAYVVNEDNVADGVHSIWNILFHLGMVRELDEYVGQRARQPFAVEVLKYSQRPSASRFGIIRYLTKPGEIVDKGQEVAKIYSILGKLVETIKAEEKAVVLGLTDSGVAVPGSPVIAFGIIGSMS